MCSQSKGKNYGPFFKMFKCDHKNSDNCLPEKISHSFQLFLSQSHVRVSLLDITQVQNKEMINMSSFFFFFAVNNNKKASICY